MRDAAPLTIQRVLTLRQFGAFKDVDLAELATVAENVVERRYAAGSVVVETGQRFPGAVFVCRGQLESAGRRWGPRHVVGGLEMITGRESAHEIRAATETRALMLSAPSFLDVLEDNYDVLSTTRRLLARTLLRHGITVTRPAVDPRVELRTLGMVERILILRGHLPFASLDALSAVAQVTDEVELPAGSRIHASGDTPARCLVILDGQIRVRTSAGRESIASSSVLGMIEAFAESPHVHDAYAYNAVRALRLPTAALFDVMEDQADLAIAVLRRLAVALIDRDPIPPEMN
jgi:CRP-like cAMP-binding protein